MTDRHTYPAPDPDDAPIEEAPSPFAAMFARLMTRPEEGNRGTPFAHPIAEALVELAERPAASGELLAEHEIRIDGLVQTDASLERAIAVLATELPPRMQPGDPKRPTLTTRVQRLETRRDEEVETEIDAGGEVLTDRVGRLETLLDAEVLDHRGEPQPGRRPLKSRVRRLEERLAKTEDDGVDRGEVERQSQTLTEVSARVAHLEEGSRAGGAAAALEDLAGAVERQGHKIDSLEGGDREAGGRLEALEEDVRRRASLEQIKALDRLIVDRLERIDLFEGDLIPRLVSLETSRERLDDLLDVGGDLALLKTKVVALEGMAEADGARDENLEGRVGELERRQSATGARVDEELGQFRSRVARLEVEVLRDRPDADLAPGRIEEIEGLSASVVEPPPKGWAVDDVLKLLENLRSKRPIRQDAASIEDLIRILRALNPAIPGTFEAATR